VRFYESVCIIDSELGEEEKENFLQSVKEAIENNEGSVSEIKDWGNRKLAYPIKDQQEGHYYIIYFSGNSVTTSELERFFKFSEEVLRYMFIRLEEEAI